MVARELIDPDPYDLDQVYLLGYDAWGQGAAVSEYLAACRASDKYEHGCWHVLSASDTIVASLIVYAEGFHLPAGFHGIGSVATDRQSRRLGYASTLIEQVVGLLDASGSRGSYLFSDIGATFYERLGFVSLGTVAAATCMLRVSKQTAVDEALHTLRSARLLDARCDSTPRYS